jgi:hypothetical protein
MSLSVKMNTKVLKMLEELFQENTVETVKHMATKYGFSEEEALREMNVTENVKIVKKGKEGKVVKEKVVKEVKEKKAKKEKKAGPKIMLPFCGRVVEEWCGAVKLNHGLYTQCTNEKSVSETSGEKYCKSCTKQAEKNETGLPNLGDINARLLKSNADYRAEQGKKCVVYAVVMKKLKITKEEAVAEALNFGLEIPADEFDLPKSHRGRPKKLSESESVKSEESEKKGRGRPKKNKTVANNQTDETDDLIASLVAEANALKGGAAVSDAEDASEADSEEEADEEESADELLLKQIVAKVNADKTYNTLKSKAVAKKDQQKHLNAIGEHIKSLLTAEEMALYKGVPEAEAEEEEEEASEAEEEEEVEEEDEEEEEEEEEDEATRKAREEAEKKAQVEAEKLKKKEQADLEKKAKKEQADLEKKAKAEAEKKAKAEAEAEKKAQVEAEKKAKKEQADLEKLKKKEQAELEKKQKKEQADLEKKAKAELEKKPAEKKEAEKKPAEKKEKKPAEKKEKKQAEVKPAEKEASAELKADVVEEANETEAEAVNAKVFEFQGKKYLKTEDGILYDQVTEECVGVWNEETKSIDGFADDEE